MKVNTNTWNKIRYSLYAHGYDIGARLLDKHRKKSIELLNIKPKKKVLIIGAGTGLDLEHMPLGCEIIATDICPTMIAKINKRNTEFNHKLQTMVMDGQNLDFEDNSFDFVILNLILTVIPNPIACIKEAERVLKPNTYAMVFDKFVKENQKISRFRKTANLFTNLLFSNITLKFEPLINHTSFTKITDIDVNLKSNFRLIKLYKN